MVFAAALVLVLAGSGLFVYVRLDADLNDSINADLRARSATTSDLVASRGPATAAATPLGDVNESFVQVLDRGGRILASAGSAQGSVLSGVELASAWSKDVWVERDVPGVDGRVRIVAHAVTDPEARMIVVGQSLINRDEALGDVKLSFALGGPVALLVASMLGYLLRLRRSGAVPPFFVSLSSLGNRPKLASMTCPQRRLAGRRSISTTRSR